MSFTVGLGIPGITPELRKYLCSLEVTNLMNQHKFDSVTAVRSKELHPELDSEHWRIGPIGGEPLYGLKRASIGDGTVNGFKAVPLFETGPTWYKKRYRS